MRSIALCLALAALPSCMVGDGEPDGDAEDTTYDPDSNVDEGDVPPMDDLVLAARLELKNPVQRNCADPGVMRDGNTWYLTCTGGGGGNHFPIYQSTDLQTWKHTGYVFPVGAPLARQPQWGTGDWWAPELHHVPGGFAAYFSATQGGGHSVGVAFSKTAVNADGYNDRGTSLVNRAESVIDAHMFIAPDHSKWLYFKTESQPDAIWGHRLNDDGMTLTAGPSTKLISATATWEHDVVEAPWVVHLGDYFYMFYSGAAYCNATYAVGVARAKSPLGPWVKKGSPILTSGSKWVGPGHNSFTWGPDGHGYMVYHAFDLAEGTPKCGQNLANDNNARHTRIDRVVLRDGWPKVLADL